MTGNGLVRVDCHLHTAVSGDAVTSLDELAERVAQEHLDVVCITDHNVTSAAVAAAERDIGARIIVGEEIRTRDGDVIGLFLTERIPYVLPLAEVTALIRGAGRADLPAASLRSWPVEPRRRWLSSCAPTDSPTSSRCSTPRSPIRR